MGSGTNTFGYDYIRKSPTNLPRMVVNEREAAIVRRVFETYASTQIGLEKIAQQLEEEEGVLTKKGRKLWRRSFLKTMLNSFLPNTWSGSSTTAMRQDRLESGLCRVWSIWMAPRANWKGFLRLHSLLVRSLCIRPLPIPRKSASIKSIETPVTASST